MFEVFEGSAFAFSFELRSQFIGQSWNSLVVAPDGQEFRGSSCLSLSSTETIDMRQYSFCLEHMSCDGTCSTCTLFLKVRAQNSDQTESNPEQR